MLVIMCLNLSNDCFSEWGTVPSGVPQGTRLYLNPPDAHSWKYVDETTLAEVVPRNGQTNGQTPYNQSLKMD